MSQTRPMTLQSVKSIMNKRTLVPTTMIGKRVRLTIQGDGNIIDVRNKAGELVANVVAGDGTNLQKKIYNCKAVSQIAMTSPLARTLLSNAVAAEKAGGAIVGKLTNDPAEVAVPHTVDEYATAYLNHVQLSFGILLPSAKIDQLANGVEIAAKVEKVTTENGSLLTLDPSTLSIVEPETLGEVAFNIDDLLAAPVEGKKETV